MSASVLIIQPDPALGERLGQLIYAGMPDAAVGLVATPQDGIAALAQYSDLDLCVTEVYFPEGDGLAFIAAIRAKFRHTRVILVSAYDLTNFEAYIKGLSQFRLPLDESVFSSTCQDALSTLEGHEFPPFRLGKKQPPDRWGDCYAAYDTGVKRDIFITICHAWATPEDALRFRNSATMMARAGHPNVQAVYQAGTYEGRDFFCREKWDFPNLSEMATAGQTIDPRVAARIVHVVGAVVIFWDANNFPHTTVGATDVTLSPQGVIKLANCVDPTQQVTPPGMSDLSALARAVSALLPTDASVPASVTNLLARLSAGPVPLAQTISEAQAIDNNLAPEREVVVSEEHQIAEQEIAKARQSQKVTQWLAIGGFVLVVLVIGVIFYMKLDPPSTDFKDEQTIPGGPYIYQSGPATMDHTFYMDKYEVTLGQYLHFLRAVAKAGNDTQWKHPLQPANKPWTHEPKDWDIIWKCIKTRQPYHKMKLTLDCPVFNVDWYDAEAYAKWAGKRLPDQYEWEYAARGKDGNLYPWGNTFAQNGNNRAPNTGQDDAPSHAYLPVDDDGMKQDVSPFGVSGMAGNVSEWTDTVAAGSFADRKVGIICGANINTNSQAHVQLTYRNKEPQNYSDYWLGFRCVSDSPPVK